MNQNILWFAFKNCTSVNSAKAVQYLPLDQQYLALSVSGFKEANLFSGFAGADVIYFLNNEHYFFGFVIQ